MSLPTIALEDLPLLPYAQYISYLDVKSLIQLSRNQDSTKELIQLLGLESGGYHISIRQNLLELRIPSRNHYQWHNDSDKDGLICTMHDVLDELKSVLPGNLDHLKIDPDLSSHFSYFNHQCTVLSIGSNTYEYSPTKVESMGPLENLDELLNKVQFEKGLALNGPKELKTENPRIFRIDWLQIRNSSWITSEFLRKLQNKVIYLTDAWSLTDQDLNEFLRDLKDGKINNPNLQMIRFGRYGGWDKSAVLEGLEVTEQRDQIFKFPDFDKRVKTEKFLPREFTDDGVMKIEESCDFTRNDGIKCSIQFSWNSVRIFVWNPVQTQVEKKTKKKRAAKKRATKKRRNTDSVNGPTAKRSC